MRTAGASSLTVLLLFAGAAALSASCGDDESETKGGTSSGAGGSIGNVDDIMGDLPQSCAFTCSDCAEPDTPYACPTLQPWDELPHADACEPFDGTYPEVTAGKCTVSDATGEAARKAGPFTGGVVLPDGHRIQPAGRELVFDETGLVGGFPMSVLAVPGTRFALASDGGIKDNVLRVIDLDALAGGGAPVASYIPFARPTSLYYGLAWLPPNRALASGGGDATVYAFDVDPATGGATRAEARDIPLGSAGGDPWYSGAIAATADGTRLLVGPSEYAEEIQILSLADADYGAKLGAVATGAHSIFDIKADPFDPTGKLFYASDQGNSRVIEIDAVAGAATRTIALERNPSQIAFLDATYMVVAEANSDALAIIDRPAGTVAARVDVFEPGAPRGASPTALAYDPATQRLYATLAGINAVDVYDVGAGSPPAITPAGRIPTAWWPTAVMVDADGSLVVLSGKGHGTGTDGEQYVWGDGPITDLMRGGIQHVPAADLADLAAETAVVDAARRLGDIEGRPEITCPAGADDFPIPKDNESGPSNQIKHVILVVRENKTYDAIFGDRADLGDGDPTLIMAPDVETQSAVWQNARAMAEQFTNFDNFYTDAEQSIQGHIWTVYGRTSDYVERSWLTTWGRATRPITSPNTSFESTPEEGGVFKWLENNGVDFDDMGEIVGGAAFDGDYPGLLYAQNVPDIDKSCYIGGRIRLRCDLKPFTYALQANDHTYGGQQGAAAPQVFISVNDEASGMLLDALSHSPTWKDSLLIITEDDPQDGGDHVDQHRSILLMASPWIRRGYVSHGHYDMASVYKLVAHIFGIPYNNEMIRNALLPADAFTSTPDYTPFDYLPRTIAAPCNGGGVEAKIAEGWDFDEPDEQPGLSEQVGRMMARPNGETGVRIVAPRR